MKKNRLCKSLEIGFLFNQGILIGDCVNGELQTVRDRAAFMMTIEAHESGVLSLTPRKQSKKQRRESKGVETATHR